MKGLSNNERPFFGQHGFTLIEMMVTIAIGLILMAIAAGAWGSLREKTRVKSAAEEIRSVLTAVRLHALSTGSDASVTFDFNANTVTSPLWGAPRTYSGVNLQAYTYTGCAGVPPGIPNNTMTFRSTGAASGSAAAGQNAVVVRPNGGALLPAYYLVLNGVTGRIRARETCP